MPEPVSSVEQVMGALLKRPRRSKQSGMPADAARRPAGRSGREGGGALRGQRLARAALGRESAVFKLIRKGGCAERKELKGQLEYVFNKAEGVFSSDGRYEAQDGLTNAQMNRITRDWEQDWWGSARSGYTSHMLLSYPIGTSREDVISITRAVCEEMFQSGEARYDYVAGFHGDRDHPHVHVIANRRGTDNRLLTFRHGTEFSYQAVRDSMVAHAERHGVYLESTSRFERGITVRPPTVKEIYAAKEEGRAAHPRPYAPSEMSYVTRQVDEAQVLYQATAAIAANEGYDVIAEACARASSILSVSGAIGVSQMSETVTEEGQTEIERLDARLAELSDLSEKVREAINEAPMTARPKLQREFTDLLAGVSQLNPHGPDTKALFAETGQVSPYGGDFIADRDRLAEPETRTLLVETVQGTGLEADEILARMEVGASREYLEQRWAIEDMQRIATHKGLAIEDQAGFREAHLALNAAYQDIRHELIDAGIANDRLGELNALDEAPGLEMTKKAPLPPQVQEAIRRFEAGDILLSPEERQDLANALRAHLPDTELDDVRSGHVATLEAHTDNRQTANFLSTELMQADKRMGLPVAENRLKAQIEQLGRDLAERRGHSRDHGLELD